MNDGAPQTSHPFADHIDLASERLSGAVVLANDEFFAAKENLIKASTAVFIPDKFTDHGKWMDGWETRRRREPGHDWCIIKLGCPGVLHGVNVDTAHFVGNHPESCSLEACTVRGEVSPEGLHSQEWHEILPLQKLTGDNDNFFEIASNDHWTHVRLNIFPDGGVARLRVYGDVVPDRERLKLADVVDVAAAENGGVVVACNDMFFGPKENLILPGPGRNMGDGWETRRKRGPGHDWIVIRLCARSRIRRLEVDTSHFKGNFPESCSLEALVFDGGDLPTSDLGDREDLGWVEILPRTKLKADFRHLFEAELEPDATRQPFDYIRLNIFPDGGVSRLRVYGELED